MEAGTSGFVSISDSDRRVPAELGQESQASSCKEEWTLARDGVSREVPCSALKGETVPDSLPAAL